MSVYQISGVINKVWEGTRKTKFGEKTGYSFEIDGVSYSGFAKGGHVPLTNGSTVDITFKQNGNYNNVETILVTNAVPGAAPAPAPQGAQPAPSGAPQTVQVHSQAPAAPPRSPERRGDSVGMAIKCACETLKAGSSMEQIEERAKAILKLGDELKHYEPMYELEWLKAQSAEEASDDAEAFQAA